MVTEAKFETVDGYTLIDIDGTSQLVGPIRSAKKVLQRTTTDLIRHATYACAVHQLHACGAAAALNHDRSADDQTPIAAFASELETWAQANNFSGAISLGLGPTEAGAALHATAAQTEETIAASAAACLAPNSTGVPGTNVVIASGDEEKALQSALEKLGIGARHESDLGAALQSSADAVFVRGKTGVLNHEVLDGINAKTIIGLQSLTTTARGLAVAGRAGTIIVPDFISAAGPILAALGHTSDDIGSMTIEVISELTAHGTDMFVAASEKAEAHLATLTETLPFGRPLAP